jgi:hypothetical protein
MKTVLMELPELESPIIFDAEDIIENHLTCFVDDGITGRE